MFKDNLYFVVLFMVKCHVLNITIEISPQFISVHIYWHIPRTSFIIVGQCTIFMHFLLSATIHMAISTDPSPYRSHILISPSHFLRFIHSYTKLLHFTLSLHARKVIKPSRESFQVQIFASEIKICDKLPCSSVENGKTRTAGRVLCVDVCVGHAAV